MVLQPYTEPADQFLSAPNMSPELLVVAVVGVVLLVEVSGPLLLVRPICLLIIRALVAQSCQRAEKMPPSAPINSTNTAAANKDLC